MLFQAIGDTLHDGFFVIGLLAVSLGGAVILGTAFFEALDWLDRRAKRKRWEAIAKARIELRADLEPTQEWKGRLMRSKGHRNLGVRK